MPEKKSILILENDPKISAQITEALSGYNVTKTENGEEFLSKAMQADYNLFLIDFDLKEKDGLLVFREMRQKNPSNKTIMFSSSNSIPLAVQATKLGVIDFLRKPFDFDVIRKSVAKAIKEEELLTLDLSKYEDTEWLEGTSAVKAKTIDRIIELSQKNSNLVITGEKGINKKVVAEIIHGHGRNAHKRFVSIDMPAFDKESLESHFFITLKELISLSDGTGIENIKNLTGTIFLSGIESISEAFRLSALQFIKDKKSPVKIIFGAYNAEMPYFEWLERLEIPSLSKRKEDLPIILSKYLRSYAPEIKYISPGVMDFFMYYDFPGNYEELKDFVTCAAVSFPGAEVLNFKSLPLDMFSFENAQKNKIMSQRNYSLPHVRGELESAMFNIIMEKSNYDHHLSARFLDIPHTVFESRLKVLGLPQ